jgi:hypothetical protein
MTLVQFSVDHQQKILWLHHQAFGGDSACKKCPGNCCDDCYHTDGYLFLSKEQTEEKKKRFGWTKQRGFKGETGCKLPPHERSATCLSFACGGIHQPSMGKRFNPPEGVNKPFDMAKVVAVRHAINDAYRELYQR